MDQQFLGLNHSYACQCFKKIRSGKKYTQQALIDIAFCFVLKWH